MIMIWKCIDSVTFGNLEKSSRPKCYVTGQAVEGWNQINSPGYPNAFPGRLECLYV